MTIRDFEPGLVRPHELFGDSWFNSDPVSVQAQRGTVLLIDFWDFTCGPALRAVPYLKDWHRKYSPDGLILLGVHTPRFAFGRDAGTVERAIQRLGLRYPIVMDNDATIWSRYGNRQWPTRYVIDRSGFIRFANYGEGGYAATEHVIQTLMLDAGLTNALPDLTEPVRDADRPGAVCFRATPELYAGYLRGSMGNVEGSVPESETHFADPGIYVEGKFYVDGDWSTEREGLRLIGGSPGAIVFRYSAQDVEAVFSAETGSSVELEIRQDGEPLTRVQRGEDVRLKGGRSILVVNEPRAYSLVRNREHGEHLLKLSVSGGGLSLYSISFASGVIPELITG